MQGILVKITLATVLVGAIDAGTADAQIMRRPTARTQPPNWIGGGVALFSAFTLQDGVTQSEWRFDSALGYTASLEHPTQAGVMIGVTGSYVTPTMIYAGSPCGSCAATGTVMQLMGLVHSGNGYSFHPAYELVVGATGFSNFREQSTGSRLGPPSTDFDFSFGVGYGLGFGLSSNVSIEVLQEIGTVLHQRTGLSAGTGNYPRIGVTKLGGKIAF